MAGSYLEAPNKVVSGANGIDYTYRELGDRAVPLVLLQHFRGNLDYWDPALIDALASSRPVVTFDNAGIGGSTGTTPSKALAQPDEVLVSRTVADLVGGSGIPFADRGTHALKGVPNQWQLFAVQDPLGADTPRCGRRTPTARSLLH
jgi:pimeloyl-ACP methyl ester carboxylesterase